MKVVALNLREEFPEGKIALKDRCIDKLKDIFHSAKKRYVEIEIIPEEKLSDADAVIVRHNDKLQIIISDIDFIEKHIPRSENDSEKHLLLKIKDILEKEKLVSRDSLTDEERKILHTYPLFCSKAIYLIGNGGIADRDVLLREVLVSAGYVVFYTSNERETRAWMIKKGASAKEAAGVIHTDIQRGFIRAEVIPAADIINANSFNAVRSQIRLEQKDYIVQDGDWILFRFNK